VGIDKLPPEGCRGRENKKKPPSEAAFRVFIQGGVKQSGQEPLEVQKILDNTFIPPKP
jgi:hypothetical protein